MNTEDNRKYHGRVVDLLLNSCSRRDAGKAIGKSGDGSIDGIIKEDKIGLDTDYFSID